MSKAKVLTRRGYKGASWDVENILYLNLDGTDYVDRYIHREKSSVMLWILIYKLCLNLKEKMEGEYQSSLYTVVEWSSK